MQNWLEKGVIFKFSLLLLPSSSASSILGAILGAVAQGTTKPAYKQRSCHVCTFLNLATASECEMCAETSLAGGSGDNSKLKTKLKLQEFGAILGHAIKRRLNHYR